MSVLRVVVRCVKYINFFYLCKLEGLDLYLKFQIFYILLVALRRSIKHFDCSMVYLPIYDQINVCESTDHRLVL